MEVQQLGLLGGWLIASLLCNTVLAKWGSMKVKMWGIFLIVVGGLGFAISALIAPKSPLIFTAAMMVYTFGVNWSQTLYFPEGMEILPSIKGITAGLLTSTRLLISALVVDLASQLYNGTIYPFVAVVVGILLIILPTIAFYEKRRATR